MSIMVMCNAKGIIIIIMERVIEEGRCGLPNAPFTRYGINQQEYRVQSTSVNM